METALFLWLKNHRNMDSESDWDLKADLLFEMRLGGSLGLEK